ncbi:PAS domain S-box-containing protein [Rhodovulum bhavnagarense]|uniref:histidine kinase n=2 Tax=Rhodovulum bhavnagarense TaxID=992286 RepID=A0A4R2R8Y3_9RHOB|nr:PAS domain S-box-containing protein [Rhodovulum bhavnagarense]
MCNLRYRAVHSRSAPVIEPGRHFEDILRYGLEHGEYAEAVGREEEWAAERLRQRRSGNHICEQLLADGRWLQITEQKTPDGGQVSLCVDITRLKQALARSDREWRATMAAARDGMGIADAMGKVRHVNRAFAEIFGLGSETDCVGQHWRMLYPPEVAAFLETTAIPETRRQGHWEGEVTIWRAQGGRVPLELSLTLRDDGGLLCAARDITSRKRVMMEQALLRDQLQAVQPREIVSRFSSEIGHDLNNLLAVIEASADMMRDGIAVEKNAERILAACRSGKDLVSRLRDQGPKTSERILMDIRPPVYNACELLRVSLGDEISLDLDQPEDPVMIDAAPTDVVQVVLNLGINARDAVWATPPGRERHIEVKVALAGEEELAVQPRIGEIRKDCPYCVIEVHDTGTGMPKAIAKNIFVPSFTTKGANGSGLGLTIVAGVAQNYGGAIALDSVLGGGTTFKFFWPLLQAEFEPVGAA